MLRRVAIVVGTLLLIGFVSILVLAFIDPMSYVPTTEQIRSRSDLQPFMIEPTAIEGIYGNMDIDAMVFRYKPGVAEDEFWRRITQQLQGTSWVAIPPEVEVRRFQRIFPPTGQKQDWWWVEEVRVRYQHDRNSVVIGWVQADSSEAVSGLSECSESKFAEDVVWPHLRAN